MTGQHEIDYCTRREQEERAAAAVAAHQAAFDAHFVMAERYADRAWSLTQNERDNDR